MHPSRRLTSMISAALACFASLPAGAADLATENTGSSLQTTLDPDLDRGMNFVRLGRLDDALASFQTAANKTDLAASPQAWLAIQTNICNTLCSMGHCNQAAEVAQDIVSKCEGSLGLTDPITTAAITNLASVLKNVGRLHEAEPVYRRSIVVLEGKYGHYHQDVAVAYTKLGSLLESLKRMDEAEPQHRTALKIVEDTTLEDDSPSLCLFLTNLAFCLQSRHQKTEAMALMDRAFKIANTVPDESMTSTGMILRKQAEFYRLAGDLDRAELMGNRALQRLARKPGTHRGRIFFYDTVTDIYKSILKARGLSDSDIKSRVRFIENAATRQKKTAAV